MEATIEVARRFPTPTQAVRRRLPAHRAVHARHRRALHQDRRRVAERRWRPRATEDLQTPLAIIYDGVEPDARVAGFMYYSMSKEAPDGFAGPNDHWHFHTSLCLKYGPDGIDLPYGFDVKIPPKQCTAIGGQLLQQSQWMVHVWSVPGWESGQGLFGEVNPALACPDGTYYQRPMKEWLAHPDNVCKSAT